MIRTLYAAGSLDALRVVLAERTGADEGELDVVVLPSAAAFTGAPEACVAIAEVCNEFAVRVEALMVTDRASTSEPYFAQRLRQADLVVLADGSSLHARTTWRNSPIGDALKEARNLVAIGSVASVLAEVMIDPRGGAPTIGLGLFEGVTFTVPASDDQLARTRLLVDPTMALVVLGPHGVVAHDEHWRVMCADGVVVTRGREPGELRLGDRH
jgi:cyanophycinase